MKSSIRKRKQRPVLHCKFCVNRTSVDKTRRSTSSMSANCTFNVKRALPYRSLNFCNPANLLDTNAEKTEDFRVKGNNYLLYQYFAFFNGHMQASN